MGEQFSEMLKNYPPGLLKAFGYDAEMPIFANIETFVSLENFSFMYQILVVGLAVSFSSWAIAGQIEKKTMSLLLSLPLDRFEIFASKYLSAGFLILIFNAATIYSIILFCKIYDLDYNLANYHKMFLSSFLFSMAIYSIAIFFSAVFRDKGKAVFIPTGIVVGMYALTVISGLKDNLADLKYGSFFYYFKATDIFVKGIYPDYMFLVFSGTIIFFSTLALIIFSKRDISV